MKKFAFAALAATVLLTMTAEAQWHRRPHRPHRPPPRHCHHCRPDVVVACAPEVVEGNTAAADRTLKSLAASKEFADAKTFKAEVARISAMEDANAKAAAYMKLADVDASDASQVYEFAGAREVSNSTLAAIQKNANLSAEQAEIVAAKIKAELRGNLAD